MIEDDIYFLKTDLYYDISLFAGYLCTYVNVVCFTAFDYCKCLFIILEAIESANVFKCLGIC